MFNKLKNKQLILLVAILLVVVLVVKFTDNKKGDRNYRSDIFATDTSDVVELDIKLKGKNDHVLLRKSEDKWEVKSGDKFWKADQNAVQYLLSELENMSPKNVAARDKSKWETFEVTDSLSTIVTAKTKKKKSDPIYIGKFSYQQPKNQQNANMYGQPQGTMTSYVRVGNESEVYAVDGFLMMTFNREPNDLRDKTLINGDVSSWSNLEISTPAEKFQLLKEGNRWMIDGGLTDSTTTAKYLADLSRLSNSQFKDDFKPTGEALATLKINGDQ